MATNFPSSVDNFTNPTSNDSLNSPSHSLQHTNANDAIEAIETYVLNQQPTFRNKIINSGFDIWQRGTSFTNLGVFNFPSDRWLNYNDGSGGTRVYSRQTFTPGTAPVAGYEAQYFFRYNESSATTGATLNLLDQRIEDVRTLAGQTVTISFWAKADANRTISTGMEQVFGSGGSSTVTYASASHSVTTSWQRFSHTLSLGSLSGKTIGTNSFLMLRFFFPVNVIQTIDIWGVQVEAGSVATPFEQRPIGTELALCQRYYYRQTSGDTYSFFNSGGFWNSTTNYLGVFHMPVTMRVQPTSVDYSTLRVVNSDNNAYAVSSLSIVNKTANTVHCDVTTASATNNRWGILGANNSATAYIGFSAEL